MLASQLYSVLRCQHLLGPCPAPSRTTPDRQKGLHCCSTACPCVAGMSLVTTLRVTQERLQEGLAAPLSWPFRLN